MQTNEKDRGGQRPEPPLEAQGTAGKALVDQIKDHPEADGDADVKLDESAQALIGHHLKAVYSEIVEQPIPEHFLKLLEDLERKERNR